MRTARPPLGIAFALALALAFALALAALLAACGGDGDRVAGVQPSESPTHQVLASGIVGGTLVIRQAEPIGTLDPGRAWAPTDVAAVEAMQRPLYSFLPNDPADPVPDLAAGPPQVRDGGRLVVVRIRRGVRFGPPVDRAVTAGDVAYAIERGANPHVGNPYFHRLFHMLVGADRARGGPIPGISTPDAQTIAFRLAEPQSRALIGALTLPLTAPVPPELARPLDAHRPSLYGVRGLAATGPYMLGPRGRATRLVLVRNPSWRASTDFRPAYADRIVVLAGARDPGRVTLAGDGGLQNGTLTPPVATLAADDYSAQLVVTDGAGLRYLALDDAHRPFDDVQVRRALWAALDRSAMQSANGGAPLGDVATHFIHPGTVGFHEAGGYAGPRVDFDRSADGDADLAARYMGRARRADLRGPVVVVGLRRRPDRAFAQAAAQAVRSLGFRGVRLRLLSAAAYARVCDPAAPRAGVCADATARSAFGDPQPLLEPTLVASALTAARRDGGRAAARALAVQVSTAELATGTAARAAAWAAVDRALVEQAVAVPYLFDSGAHVRSRDVRGVTDQWNAGEWDYSFSSLRPPPVSGD